MFKHNMHFCPQEVNIYVVIVDVPSAVFFRLRGVKPVEETLEKQ